MLAGAFPTADEAVWALEKTRLATARVRDSPIDLETWSVTDVEVAALERCC